MLKIKSLPEVMSPEQRADFERAMLKHHAYFIEGYAAMAKYIFDVTAEKGFWKDGKDRNQPEMIALMHSELSEALEALRKGPHDPDKHCPEFTNLEVELADTIVRIMDFGHALGLRVPEALCAKVNINAQRPKMHGKAF